MRSLFVFPALDRREALRRLAVANVRTKHPVGVSEPDQHIIIWAEVVEDLQASDFTPEDIVEIERVAGFRPDWGIEIAISGHFEDWRQRNLRTLTTWLLSDGGCATSIEVDEFKTAEQWREDWAG